MKAVLQRVTSASVSIEGSVCARIGLGYVLLLGIGQQDTTEQADKMIGKIKKLRIFADAQGKTNLSIEEVGGGLLVVSQFTLYADCRKGNRPSFTDAARPEQAEALYQYFVNACRPQFNNVACGVFGADMAVSLVNDGPFTVVLEID